MYIRFFLQQMQIVTNTSSVTGITSHLATLISGSGRSKSNGVPATTFRKFFEGRTLDKVYFSLPKKVKCYGSCTNMGAKSAMVVLAEGAEEMECVISIDVLRRAGIQVTVAGIGGSDAVKCSRDVVIKPDLSLKEAVQKGPYDVIILPGGLKGSQGLAASAEVGSALKEQESQGRVVAAICAAPTALKAHGIGTGKRLTSYPSVKNELLQGGNYNYLEDRVVVDGNLITSRGPGTAFEFALAIVQKLLGTDAKDPLIKSMLLDVPS